MYGDETASEPPSVETLIAALGDDDPDERAWAACELGRRADPRAVEPLLGCLADEGRRAVGVVQMSVSWSAAEALGELADERAVEPLIAALQVGQHNRPSLATEVEEEARASDVLTALTVLRRDPTYGQRGLRYRAATALGKIRDRRAVDPLMAAATDPDDALRIWAGVALANIGDVRAFDALITLLQDANQANVSRNIAVALSGMGERAVAPLLMALQHNDRRVRYWATDALGQLGDKRALEALRSLRTDPDDDVRSVARAAIDALSQDRAAQMVADMRVHVEAADRSVKAAMVQTLTHMGKRRAVPALMALLSDEDPDTRAAAAVALGQLGEAQVVPLLEHMQENDTGRTREGAAVKHVANIALRCIRKWQEAGLP